MQFQKIPALTDRHQILAEFKTRLEEELVEHEEVLGTLGKVTGLSKDDVDYGIKTVQQSILDVKALLCKVDRLTANNEKVNLLIFQHTYAKAPAATDGFYLAADDTYSWAGTKKILIRTEFYDKPAGSQWSSFHLRAEVDEFFHLYTRI